MGDKEIGVSKKRSIFFTCIFDGTDKYAPYKIRLAARTAFQTAFGRVSMEILLYLLNCAKTSLTFKLHKIDLLLHYIMLCVLADLHYFHYA